MTFFSLVSLLSTSWTTYIVIHTFCCGFGNGTVRKSKSCRFFWQLQVLFSLIWRIRYASDGLHSICMLLLWHSHQIFSVKNYILKDLLHTEQGVLSASHIPGGIAETCEIWVFLLVSKFESNGVWPAVAQISIHGVIFVISQELTWQEVVQSFCKVIQRIWWLSKDMKHVGFHLCS